MKKTLTDWANVAEIIGAFAIVLSLIFVGVQISQNAEETALNTRQIQAAAFSDLTNSLNLINHILIENPETRDVYIKVKNGQELTPNEEELFQAFVRNFGQLSELAWQQYESGIISETNLKLAIVPLVANIWLFEHFRETYINSAPKSDGFLEYLVSLPPDPSSLISSGQESAILEWIESGD